MARSSDASVKFGTDRPHRTASHNDAEGWRRRGGAQIGMSDVTRPMEHVRVWSVLAGVAPLSPRAVQLLAYVA